RRPVFYAAARGRRDPGGARMKRWLRATIPFTSLKGIRGLPESVAFIHEPSYGFHVGCAMRTGFRSTGAHGAPYAEFRSVARMESGSQGLNRTVEVPCA